MKGLVFMKAHWAQSTLFSVLIFCGVLFLVAGLMAGTMVKIYQKAEDLKDEYSTWQFNQYSQLTDEEQNNIDLTIEEILEKGRQ